MPIAEPSVQALQLRLISPGGSTLGPATAFLARSGNEYWLITNWHVLSGRNAETGDVMSATGATPVKTLVRFHSPAGLGSFTEVELPLVDDDERPLWLEHPQFGRQVDVAALRVPQGTDGISQITSSDGFASTVRPLINFYAADLANPDPAGIFVSIGERLSVVGFPIGEDVQGFPIWTQGFVASEPDLRYRSLPCFLIDSRTRQGQSGSPVFFYSASGQYPSAVGVTTLGLSQINSRLMGVYSGRINAESDIGRVWTTQAVIEVVDGMTRATRY
jgi:hypothetical protein